MDYETTSTAAGAAATTVSPGAPHGNRGCAPRFSSILLVAGLAAAVALPASADSVYLKHGGVIHSSSVRVEGDRVVIAQYGGAITVPMSMVERIEENDLREPAASPTASPSEYRRDREPGAVASPAADSAMDGGTASRPFAVGPSAARGTAGSSAADPAATAPLAATGASDRDLGSPALVRDLAAGTSTDPEGPSSLRYWRSHFDVLDALIAGVEDKLARLRNDRGGEGAALGERLRQQLIVLQQLRRGIVDDALRAGIPRDVLRR